MGRHRAAQQLRSSAASARRRGETGEEQALLAGAAPRGGALATFGALHSAWRTARALRRLLLALCTRRTKCCAPPTATSPSATRGFALSLPRRSVPRPRASRRHAAVQPSRSCRWRCWRLSLGFWSQRRTCFRLRARAALPARRHARAVPSCAWTSARWTTSLQPCEVSRCPKTARRPSRLDAALLPPPFSPSWPAVTRMRAYAR